jgi:hypothetical protein
MQTARTASDVDQMVWRLSSNAPFARDAKELKNSMPLGLMGLLDDDEEAEALFGGSETNAVLREVATKGRDERGPVAPALGTRHLERLLQEERDKVAVLEARVAELETQLAAERVAAQGPAAVPGVPRGPASTRSALRPCVAVRLLYRTRVSLPSVRRMLACQ